MEIQRSSLKARAAELIRIAEPKPLWVGLVYLLIAAVFSWLISRNLGANMTEEGLKNYYTYYLNGNFDYASRYLMEMLPPRAAFGVSALLDLVLSIVSAGFILFLLNTIRGAGASFGNLLDGFGMFGRILLLDLLEALLIGLWSLLLFFPGIIAAYRYRMAIYLLLDHPEYSVLDCLRESRRMMDGHKWELFLLDLSFIGWTLLAEIPYLGFATQAWSLPYRNMSYALYYEALRGEDIFKPIRGVETDRDDNVPWDL